MATLLEVRAKLLDVIEALDAYLAQPATPVAPTPAEPPPASPVAALAWGKKVSPVFRDRVRWIAETLDFDPNWLMACMAFETGRRFTPDVKNPRSTATGLIQFMRATAIGLGTTVEALAKMTAEDQLNYVYKYFRDRIKERGPIRRLSDCYMAILNPVAMGKPDSYEMWVSGSQAYAVNAGLDANKDYKITKAEAAAKVHAMLAEGLMPQNMA